LLAWTLTLAIELTVDSEEESANWKFKMPQDKVAMFHQDIDGILMVCRYSI
jgi:hypothetical protein